VVRTQIQLTESQMKSLQELASKQGVSMAELIRRSVDNYLGYHNGGDRANLMARAREAAGKYRAVPADLAENHDRYLTEDLHK
jgi:predicted DNA-binding ribbon-helix-helix protein